MLIVVMMYVFQTYSVRVAENIEVGSRVIQVTAVDPDAGSNSAVHYHISRAQSSVTSQWFSVTSSLHGVTSSQLGVTSQWFSVNEETGLISVVKSLDRERYPVMQFHVSLITYSSTYKYSLTHTVPSIALSGCLGGLAGWHSSSSSSSFDFHYHQHAFLTVAAL